MFQSTKSKAAVAAAVLILAVLALAGALAWERGTALRAAHAADAAALADLQGAHLQELGYAEARRLEAVQAVDEMEKVNAGLAAELRDVAAKYHAAVAQTIHGEGTANATMQCPVQDPTVVHEVSYIPTKVQLTLSTDVAEVRAADGKLYFKGVNRAVVKDALDKTTMLDVKIPFEAAKSYVIEAQPVPEPELRPAELTVGLGPLAALGRTNALGGAVSLTYASKERRLSKTLTTRGWGATALVGYAGGDGIAYLGASKTFDLRGRR